MRGTETTWSARLTRDGCAAPARRWRLAALLVAAAAALSGCAVAGSQFLDETHAVACRSASLGSYALPRSVLQIAVVETTDGGGKKRILDGPNVRAVADPRHVYCLDYLASPTSDDIVDVKKTNGGLLTLVATDIIDRSREIAVTLTRAAFTLATGLRSQTLGSDTTRSVPFRYEVDPFDHADMAAMNERLSSLGFCLINPGWSFDPDRAGIDAYCDGPEKTVRHAPPKWVAAQRRQGAGRRGTLLPTTPLAPKVTDTRLLSGVLYRPRLDHTLLVLEKRAHRRWELTRRERLLLENVSPILSVGVSRAFFSDRITILRFDNGVLGNVCIYKGSELEAAATVPFLVASALVALPATLIQVKINTAQDRERLAELETYLADLQTEMIAALAEDREPRLGSAPTTGSASALPAAVADAKFNEILKAAKLDGERKTAREKWRKQAFFSDKATDYYGCPAALAGPSVDPVAGFSNPK